MASTKQPKYPSCRLCGAPKALHGITRREKGLIVWYAVCSDCRRKESYQTMAQSPVFFMMNKSDIYEITLIAVMDMMTSCLIDRNVGKKRAYRFERLKRYLEDIEATYEGCIPEEMSNQADKFNRMISSDLTALLKTTKGTL